MIIYSRRQRGKYRSFVKLYDDLIGKIGKMVMFKKNKERKKRKEKMKQSGGILTKYIWVSSRWKSGGLLLRVGIMKRLSAPAVITTALH